MLDETLGLPSVLRVAQLSGRAYPPLAKKDNLKFPILRQVISDARKSLNQPSPTPAAQVVAVAAPREERISDLKNMLRVSDSRNAVFVAMALKANRRAAIKEARAKRLSAELAAYDEARAAAYMAEIDAEIEAERTEGAVETRGAIAGTVGDEL